MRGDFTIGPPRDWLLWHVNGVPVTTTSPDGDNALAWNPGPGPFRDSWFRNGVRVSREEWEELRRLPLGAVAGTCWIASLAHEDQVDQDGRPHIEHVKRVAARLDTVGERVVANLHDVLEDSDRFTPEVLLEMGVPRRLLDAVEALTKRDGERYDDYLERVVAFGATAARVKLADVRDNRERSRKADLVLLEDKYMRAEGRLASACWENGWSPATPAPPRPPTPRLQAARLAMLDLVADALYSVWDGMLWVAWFVLSLVGVVIDGVRWPVVLVRRSGGGTKWREQLPELAGLYHHHDDGDDFDVIADWNSRPY